MVLGLDGSTGGVWCGVYGADGDWARAARGQPEDNLPDFARRRGSKYGKAFFVAAKDGAAPVPDICDVCRPAGAASGDTPAFPGGA